MKKIGLFLTVVSVTVLLTGCGKNKNLICVNEGTDLGKKMKQNMEVVFKDQKVTKVTSKIETTFEDEYKEELNTSYKALKESLKQYKEKDGIKTKLTKGDHNITVVLEFDIKKQAEHASGSGIDTTQSKEEIKKDLESQGYSCK